jgi:hypothetical protein
MHHLNHHMFSFCVLCCLLGAKKNLLVLATGSKAAIIYQFVYKYIFVSICCCTHQF